MARRVRTLEASNRRLRREIRVRAAVEESLLASERKYRDLVSSAIDGICILQNQMLTYVNPQLCEMMECGQERLIGTPFADYLAPEEQERAVGLYRRMISRELPPQRYETVLVSTAGRRLDVGISATMAQVEDKPSVVIVVHDISGQKKARQMAIENERLEAVQTMARGVGNNFANILSVINSYAASIADSFLPNTAPHESARKIIDAARHAGDLTKRLLGVVRVSGAGVDVNVQAVDIGPALDKALELILPTLKEQNITLEVHPPSAPLYGQADAGQLLDVLMNIFLNAVDAMPHGGVLKIDALADEERGVAAAGPCVLLRVTDNGTGMAPHEMSKVFQPFFTTKADRDAFGLGLSVAQSMVRGWGGRIAVTSSPGTGTGVSIIMRRVDPPPRETIKASVRQTVLLVDDHARRRRMMVKALEKSGYTVMETGDGARAIEVFRENAADIDLTVIDWIMPGVDGREVLQVIHAHDPSKRVLMTSGFSRDYVRSQIRMGAWSFLQKPFSSAQFMDAVGKALGSTTGK